MATPTVFISSTCYDLNQIRNDLRTFVLSLGYEPRLSEYHDVPFNKTDSLATDCYAEVGLCDIVVGIIGGRFGSTSADQGKSVSMKEIDAAIEKNKQIYIFILRDVLAEHRTYLANKGNTVNYVSVDTTKIFEYISELQSRRNIVINAFSNAEDITQCLKSQWAGLFQTYLNDKERLFNQKELLRLSELLGVMKSVGDNYEKLLDAFKHNIAVTESTKIFVNPVNVEFRDTFFDQSMPIILFKSKAELIKYIEACGYREDVENESLITYKSDTHAFVFSNDIFEQNGDLKFVPSMTIRERREKNPIFQLQHLEVDDDDELPF